MKGNLRKSLILGLSFVLMLALSGCSQSKKTALDPKNPVTVTVWDYYNGSQLEAFEKLIEEFNSTVGLEKGIVIVSESQGDINTLANALLDSVDGKAGAKETPNLAGIYAETAFILDQKNALSSFDTYFTNDELSTIIDGFLEEGRFNENNDLLLYPIIKSTELFTANETDWKEFADATGYTLESVKTKEDLTAAAKAYYDYTDAKTPNVKEDGKALYGRDSIANYVYSGCYELGHNLFNVKDGKVELDMDRDTFKVLWDNYYVPYINGYFGAYAKFRSEDAKTGQILALTSSSSSVSYLPDQVTISDKKHPISMYITKDLLFKNATTDTTVQQGASYCLLKSTEAQEEGACEFLKWFSDTKQNMNFAVQSGYSPVTKEANNKEAIEKAYTGDTSNTRDKNILTALEKSADAFSNSTAYSTKAFKGSKDIRYYIEDTFNARCSEDRDAVVSAIKKGATKSDAVKEFTSDAYFDDWFNQLKINIEELMK